MGLKSPALSTAFWDYWPDYVSGEAADRYLSALHRTLAWQQKEISLFGKKVMQPRLMAYYGDAGTSYRYSGLLNEPLPFTEELQEIRQMLQQSLHLPFNCVLANLYRDGKDSMAWHSDNEPELGQEPVIASLNFGQARKFQFRKKAARSKINALVLAHGSLLLMKKGCQETHLHALPKASTTGTRINLTFRYIA